MKTVARFLALATVLLCAANGYPQQFGRLTPRQLGEKISLEYAISGEEAGQTFSVALCYSTNGGKTFTPLKSVSGDVGPGVAGGRSQLIVWDVLKDLKELSSDVVFKVMAEAKSVVPLQDDFRQVTFRLESLSRTPKGEVELTLAITNNGATRSLKMINGQVTITDFKRRQFDAQQGRIAEVTGNEHYSTPQRTLKQGETVKAIFAFGKIPADADRAMRLDLGVELITDEVYGIDLKIGRLQFRDLPITPARTAGMKAEKISRFEVLSEPQRFTVKKQEIADSNAPVITLIQPANIHLVGSGATRGRPYAQSAIGMDDKRLRSLASGEELATTEGSLAVKGSATDENGIYGVTVNGVEVSVSPKGLFEAVVPLAVGRNEVVIRAVDLRRNSAEQKFFVLRKTAPGKVDKSDTEELDLVFDRQEAAPRFYALIMGANDYADNGIADLDNPIRDAAKLCSVLTTRYTFEPANVVFLKNPTREQIINELDGLTRRVSSNDNLLIFFAGHGYWDQKTDFGYWIPTDSKANSTSNWMANSQIRDYVAAIKSRHTLLIADACFGGSIFRSRKAFQEGSSTIKKAYDAPSRKAMTSGNLTEVPDRSAFLEQLVTRLSTNTKDYITAEEIFGSIKDVVLSSSPVTPVYGDIKDAGDEGGDFIFVKK